MDLVLNRSRSVPWLVRLTVLFGGGFQPFGWFFFGFGMIFVWVFVPQMDLTAWRDFRGERHQATGVVTAVAETRYSEGGSKSHRGTPVFRIDYEFTVGGEKFAATSFALGATVAVGERVAVEYPPGQPSRARIEGLRRAPVSPFALVVLIFPLVGLGVVLFGLRAGWRALALLAHGEWTRGRLVAKAPTNVRVNKRPVFKLTFEFTDQAGQPHRAEARTHQPERLEDEAEEWLLYNSWRPERAVLLDGLPGRLRLNAAGEIMLGRKRAAVGAILAPLLALGANVLGLWLLWQQ